MRVRVQVGFGIRVTGDDLIAIANVEMDLHL